MTPADADPPSGAANFYADIIDAAQLERARERHGIDDEIAVLRVRLHQVMSENKDDYATMLKLLAGLTRAVQAAYRMDPKAAAWLGTSLAEVTKDIRDQFFPEEAPPDA